MKKAKRIIAALISAIMLGTVCSVPAIADADNISSEENTESISCKSMTLDDALKDMLGNYVWVTGAEPEIIPIYNITYGGFLAVDENDRLHNIQVRKVVTVIKVKSGRELPYDDIKAAVEADGRVMPVIRKNGNDYEIISASSKDNYYYTLDLIRKCPEVTAIEIQFGIFEDTANSIMFGGWLYSGELSPEELREKYPELGTVNYSAIDEYIFCHKDDNANLYDFVCKVMDNGDSFDSASYVSTELALLNPRYYYCNKPVLIDGTDGDANIDGYVDVSDSVMIMQSLANPDKYGIRAEKGITAQGRENADTDSNGLTNMDALEIQKSLLGLGNIPIPPKDSTVDTVSVDLVSYDHIDITDESEYRTVSIDDKEYINTGVTLSIGKIGDKIGEFETVSIENGNRPATIYKINDVTSDYAVAVKFSDSNNYYVARYIWYIPATVGQLIDELHLEEYLSFTNVYYNSFSPEHKTTTYEPEKDLIWNTLFSDRNIEVGKRHTENIPNNRKVKIDIGFNLPVFGRYNFGISVYDNGYVSTNIVDAGIEFFIGQEKAQELIDFYSK